MARGVASVGSLRRFPRPALSPMGRGGKCGSLEPGAGALVGRRYRIDHGRRGGRIDQRGRRRFRQGRDLGCFRQWRGGRWRRARRFHRVRRWRRHVAKPCQPRPRQRGRGIQRGACAARNADVGIAIAENIRPGHRRNPACASARRRRRGRRRRGAVAGLRSRTARRRQVRTIGASWRRRWRRGRRGGRRGRTGRARLHALVVLVVAAAGGKDGEGKKRDRVGA